MSGLVDRADHCILRKAFLQRGDIIRTAHAIEIARRRKIGERGEDRAAVLDDAVEFARGELREPQRILANFGLAELAAGDLVVGLDRQCREH